MPAFRSRIGRQPRPSHVGPTDGAGSVDDPTMSTTSLDQQLLSEFRRPKPVDEYSAGPPPIPGAIRRARPTPAAPPTQAGRGRAAQSDAGSRVARLEQQLAALEKQTAALTTTVNSWHDILLEITQTVFPQIATALVDVPYYHELPASRDELRVFDGTVPAGAMVTLVYPQVERAGLLFMRMRTTEPSTGAVNQFYIPVTNETLTATELQQCTRINSADDKFFNGFHLAGEVNPLDTTGGADPASTDAEAEADTGLDAADGSFDRW